jgi:hypothetical protein
MNETNERSVASAGSGSRLPAHLIRPEWMELARAMTFFGEPLDKLSRDELLGVAGYLADQVEQERKFHHSTLDILKAAASVSE